MSSRKKAIASMVEGMSTIPWVELKTYEFNDLKEVESADIAKLKNAIVNDGFCFPIEIWASHRYVIDGRGRDKALRELEAEGYQIPDLPVVEIRAASREVAKRLVLMRASQHGRLTQESFNRFTSDIDIRRIDAFVSLPNIEIGLLDSDLGEDDPPDDFEEFEGTIEPQNRCPKCGFLF